MKTSEQRFIDIIGSSGNSGNSGGAEADVATLLAALRDWLASLDAALTTGRIEAGGLQPGSALAQRIAALHQALAQQHQQREAQWLALAPARALAQRFEGKLMVLVFGKFNAGKSSLCNFLAERFRQHGQAVQYFHLQGGQLLASDEAFHEGATETTARLQGVCLGDGLVLLDTPGLHSATDDNAALTQRFLDSADAVLWLTSSTSPGQVQELDELARELRRGKPLLPVVTRSDVIDEDEVDGQIVKCLRNKSDANRADQEADVGHRAADKLHALGVAAAQLKPAVSVSAYVARSTGADAEAMTGAGFERLYAALLELLAPALAYRARKPAEVLLHHLQEEVEAPLLNQTMPALTALRQQVQEELDSLPARQARLVQQAWREVMPQLADLLEAHAGVADVAAVVAALNAALQQAATQHAQACLDSHILPAVGTALDLPADLGYDSAPTDGLPAAYEKLYETLGAAVQDSLQRMAGDLAERCAARLQALDQALQHKQQIILDGQRRLGQIASLLRGLHAGANQLREPAQEV
ncbi:dynamin family protein [Herbaspirillum frisingense]|uniref:dynamin family protein n=1 Tax=Herbaspirillum frisingense TaxID=92645 RepID=UPI001F30E560|nr:dynamin family protein [Herbaspirillum frisingense]UIN22674.1 dynamin family protein [Herbaspirillum frisingense]